MKKIVFLMAIFIGIYSCQDISTDKTNSTPLNQITSNNIQDNSMTNLYDAFGKEHAGLIKDFGFSALIKYKGQLILFDSGTDADILKNNAKVLGIDLSTIDFAVGSHAHGDHINGFDYLLSVNPNVKIYLPSDFFIGGTIDFNIAGKEENIKDSIPIEMRYFGGEKTKIQLKQSGRFWNANVEYIKENTLIAEGIQLLHTRSPFLGYCSNYPSLDEINTHHNKESKSSNQNTKYTGLPELSLSLQTQDGEVLVVGCSHSSVQSIVRESQKVSNRPIALLAGGFHLLPYDRNSLKNVAFQLQSELEVKQVAPTHCTGHLAFKILKEQYKEKYIFAGLGESILFNK